MIEIKEIKRVPKIDDKILSVLKRIFNNILNTIDFKITENTRNGFIFQYVGDKEKFDTMQQRLINYANHNKFNFSIQKIINGDNQYCIDDIYADSLNFLKNSKIKKATFTDFYYNIQKILIYSYCSYIGDGIINGYKLCAIDLPYYLNDDKKQKFLNELQNIFNMYYNNISFMFSRKEYAPELKTIWLAIKTNNEKKIKNKK